MFRASGLVRVETVEMTGDDGYGHGERQDPGDGARRTDELAERADRHLVAVADRRHRYDRPPESVRYALDLRALDAQFGVVDGAAVEQHEDEQDDEEEAELLAARPHRQYEYLKSVTAIENFRNKQKI